MADLQTYTASFDAEAGYLDWAAFGPPPPSVRAQAQADAELLGSGRRSGIDLVGENVSEARELVAELLGTAAEHVVLQPSTSHGLMQAMYGLTGGLLVSTAEYPALTIIAARAAAASGALSVHGLEAPDGHVTPEAVREALTDDITAVAVSLVDFRTGYRADLTALREVIGDRILIVDAIQGFGIVDADYAAADVVCAHGYKWMRAGRGTGFASFGDRALERIVPALSGPEGVDGDLPLDIVPPPSASARAFTVSFPDALAAGRLTAALRDVRDVGVTVIEAEIAARSADVIFFADRYEIPVVTPRDPGRRAGIVTLAPAAQDVGPLAASLANHGLTVTVRGGRVRVAPHVGTGADTLRLFGDALASFAAARVW